MYVTVATYNNPVEAHISRGLMESEGIPARLESEHHVWANWQMSQALGGVRVLVPAPMVKQAREVLSRRDNGEFEAVLFEQDLVAAPKCGVCGGESFTYARSWMAIFTGLAVWLSTGTVFPIPKERRCKTCGATEIMKDT